VDITLPLGGYGGGDTSTDGLSEITLHDTQVYGTYSVALDSISDGLLAGAISKTDAQKFVIYKTTYGGVTYNVTLDAAFIASNLSANYTLPGGAKGYAFIFSYTAQLANIVPASGGKKILRLR